MLSLLGVIEQCLKAGKKQHWRTSSITNICVGLLAGFKVLFILLLVWSKFLVSISPNINILISFSSPVFAFFSTTNIRTRDFGVGAIYFSGRKPLTNTMAHFKYLSILIFAFLCLPHLNGRVFWGRETFVHHSVEHHLKFLDI